MRFVVWACVVSYRISLRIVWFWDAENCLCMVCPFGVKACVALDKPRGWLLNSWQLSRCCWSVCRATAMRRLAKGEAFAFVISLLCSLLKRQQDFLNLHSVSL